MAAECADVADADRMCMLAMRFRIGAKMDYYGRMGWDCVNGDRYLADWENALSPHSLPSPAPNDMQICHAVNIMYDGCDRD